MAYERNTLVGPVRAVVQYVYFPQITVPADTGAGFGFEVTERISMDSTLDKPHFVHRSCSRRAGDANCRLFRKGRSKIMNLVKVRVNWLNYMISSNSPEGEYLCIPGEWSIRGVVKSALICRAWVFQERPPPALTVHFMEKELSRECGELSASNVFPTVGLEKAFFDDVKDVPIRPSRPFGSLLVLYLSGLLCAWLEPAFCFRKSSF